MIRLALIGRAEDAACYARIVQRIRGGEYAAVVNPSALIATTLATALNAPISTDSFDQLLNRHQADFDAVVIHANAEESVVSISQRAVRADKHVFVENALALPPSTLKDLVKVCSGAKACLMLGQPARFVPAVQTVKKCLDAGQLGEPGLLRIHRWEPSTQNASRAGSNGSSIQPESMLFKHLTAELDLVCWLFGQVPDCVFASGRACSQPKRGRLDYLQVHLGFKHNGMALVDIAESLPTSDGYYSLSLVGSTGATYADDHHNVQLLYAGETPKAIRTGQSDAQLLAQLQEFVNSIVEKRSPIITAADGLRAVQVAEAVVESMTTQQAIAIPIKQIESPILRS